MGAQNLFVRVFLITTISMGTVAFWLVVGAIAYQVLLLVLLMARLSPQ
jgi:hypothetical protein